MLFLLILIIAGVVGAGHKQTSQQMYDLNLGKEISMSEALTALKQKRVILVGEHHSNKKHHEAHSIQNSGCYSKCVNECSQGV